jgi:hypothetical protein
MARRLLRTAARTAVIAGTATSVSGRVARNQQRRFAAQDADGAPNAQARDGGSASVLSPSDVVARLQQLAELRASGALSAKEFNAAKAKLLA